MILPLFRLTKFHELVDPVFNWDLKTQITNARLLSMIQSLELFKYTLITNALGNGGMRTRTTKDNSGANGHCNDLIVPWMFPMNTNNIHIRMLFIDSNHMGNIIL